MKKTGIITASILIIFLIFFLFLSGNRDEKIIRKNLHILARTVSKSKDGDSFTLIKKTQKIQLFFAHDCRIIITHELIPEIDGLNKLIAVFHQIYRLIDEIKVIFYDVSITLAENKITAIVSMTAKATGFGPQEEECETEIQEFKMRWKKTNRKWKITEVETIKVLSCNRQNSRHCFLEKR